MRKFVAYTMITLLFMFCLTLISGCGARETVYYPGGKGTESVN